MIVIGRRWAVLAAVIAAIIGFQQFSLGQSAAGASPASDELMDMRITDLSGPVLVIPREHPEQSFAAIVGMPLQEGDVVKTADNGGAEIGMEGDSVVELAGRSEMKIESSRRLTPVLSLALGSLFGKVRSLFSSGGELQVRTPTAVASVRGTEFGVESDPAGVSSVGVFDEGHVAVVSPSGGVATMLGPNQETSVMQGQVPQAAHPLARFLARRAVIRRLRLRALGLRRSWRRLSVAERMRARARWLEAQREDRRAPIMERRRWERWRRRRP